MVIKRGRLSNSRNYGLYACVATVLILVFFGYTTFFKKSEAVLTYVPIYLTNSTSRCYYNPSKLGFDQIFVINLKKRPERLHRVIEEHQKLGLSFKVVWGPDGSELNREAPEILEFCGRNPCDVHRGRIANALAHYGIWKEAIAMNYSNILIMEDDALIQPWFYQNQTDVWQQINSLPFQYDYMLVGRGANLFQQPDTLRLDRNILAVGPHWNTFCYGISRSGLEKVMKWVAKYKLTWDVMDVTISKLMGAEYLKEVDYEGLNFKVIAIDPPAHRETEHAAQGDVITVW